MLKGFMCHEQCRVHSLCVYIWSVYRASRRKQKVVAANGLRRGGGCLAKGCRVVSLCSSLFFFFLARSLAMQASCLGLLRVPGFSYSFAGQVRNDLVSKIRPQVPNLEKSCFYSWSRGANPLWDPQRSALRDPDKAGRFVHIDRKDICWSWFEPKSSSSSRFALYQPWGIR